MIDAQLTTDSLDLGEVVLGEDGIGPNPGLSDMITYYFHSDHLGSSTAITDGSGYLYQIFLNLPFGETMAEQRRSGTFSTAYKFNGKELDSETGLYYYGARYYNPRISNWLSVDPLTEQTMTPYQYTYQNPVRYTDPTGMAPVDIIYGFKMANGKNIYYIYRDGTFFNIASGKKADYSDNSTTNTNMLRAQTALNQMKNSNDEVLKNQIDVLSKSSRRHIITDVKSEVFKGRVQWLNPDKSIQYRPSGYDECVPYETLIQLDFSNTVPTKSLKNISEILAYFITTDFELVAHELGHAYEADTGTYNPTDYKKHDKHNDPKEINATVNGNRARRIEGRLKEIRYGGKLINKEKLEKAEKNSGY